MAYASRTEIISEFKKLVVSVSGTAVIEAEIDRFLAEADAEINSYISARYTLPITGTDSLLILKKCEIDLVVFRIVKILNVKKAFTVSDKNIIQEITEGTAYKQAMRKLELIAKGTINLHDAVEKSGTTAFGSFATANNQTPIFKKDVRQW